MDGEGVIFHLFSNFFMESILGVGGKENRNSVCIYIIFLLQPDYEPTCQQVPRARHLLTMRVFKQC